MAKLTEAQLNRARSGLNGKLVKSWETHCVRCEVGALGYGYGGSTQEAAAELRRNGWRTRQSYWTCPVCVSDLASLPQSSAPDRGEG